MSETEQEIPEGEDAEPETEPAEPAEPADDELEAEEEDDAEPEPEPEPEAPSGFSEKAMERAVKKLEAEASRHANRVSEIMGEDANDLTPCPLCAPNIPGFRWPFPPAADVVAAVKDAIGEPASPTYAKDSYSRECDLCHGLGSVATGSKVAGQGVVGCLKCKGKGWVAVGPERESGAVTVTNGAPLPVDYGATVPDAALPPEAEALKALGYIVVPPIQAPV